MKILTDRNTAFEFENHKPSLAFLPIGATEQHSRHLPIATDSILADAFSADILQALELPGFAYLLPILPISSSEENTGFKGTISLSPLTMRTIIQDIWRSLSSEGIQQLVICPWHGGNFIIKPVIREMNCEMKKCHLFYLNPWETVPQEIYNKFAKGFEVHSGDVETSLMLATAPEFVRDERVDNPLPNFNPALQDMWSMKTLSKGEGHAGHPTQATVEKGKIFKEALISHSATYLQKLLEMAEKNKGY